MGTSDKQHRTLWAACGRCTTRRYSFWWRLALAPAHYTPSYTHTHTAIHFLFKAALHCAHAGGCGPLSRSLPPHHSLPVDRGRAAAGPKRVPGCHRAVTPTVFAAFFFKFSLYTPCLKPFAFPPHFSFQHSRTIYGFTCLPLHCCLTRFAHRFAPHLSSPRRHGGRTKWETFAPEIYLMVGITLWLDLVHTTTLPTLYLPTTRKGRLLHPHTRMPLLFPQVYTTCG